MPPRGVVLAEDALLSSLYLDCDHICVQPSVISRRAQNSTLWFCKLPSFQQRGREGSQFLCCSQAGCCCDVLGCPEGCVAVEGEEVQCPLTAGASKHPLEGAFRCPKLTYYPFGQTAEFESPLPELELALSKHLVQTGGPGLPCRAA